MSEAEGKIRIRVAALVVKENRILLADHMKGGRRYSLLPGGGLEYGETLEEALVRELEEEAGLEIRVGDLLWTLDSIPPDRHRHVLNLVFEAQALSENLTQVKESVLQGVRWCPLQDFPRLTLYPDMKREILDYLEKGRVERRNLGSRWDG